MISSTFALRARSACYWEHAGWCDASVFAGHDML